MNEHEQPMNFGSRLCRLLRVLIACIVAPGLLTIIASYFVAMLGVTLPDNFGIQVFETEMDLLYVFVLPVFIIFYACRMNVYVYTAYAAFALWPVWGILVLLPSDASVDPADPQLFLAPTTTAFGAISGVLFFLIAGKRLPET